MLLSLKNIQKTYKTGKLKNQILSGVSLDIKPGEIVSVSGKSGSGKSTLLNIITGLTRPDKGSIFLKNKELKFSSDRHMSRIRSRELGQIFQTFNLIHSETVMSNIMLAREISSSKNSMNREEIMDLLDNLGISQFHNVQAGLLSGGQRQRVAIARALINRPDIILADEPTANLDDTTSKDIFKILTSLKEQNKGLLIVTHKRYMHNRSERIFKLEKGILTKK